MRSRTLCVDTRRRSGQDRRDGGLVVLLRGIPHGRAPVVAVVGVVVAAFLVCPDGASRAAVRHADGVLQTRPVAGKVRPPAHGMYWGAFVAHAPTRTGVLG